MVGLAKLAPGVHNSRLCRGASQKLAQLRVHKPVGRTNHQPYPHARGHVRFQVSSGRGLRACPGRVSALSECRVSALSECRVSALSECRVSAFRSMRPRWFRRFQRLNHDQVIRNVRDDPRADVPRIDEAPVEWLRRSAGQRRHAGLGLPRCVGRADGISRHYHAPVASVLVAEKRSSGPVTRGAPLGGGPAAALVEPAARPHEARAAGACRRGG